MDPNLLAELGVMATQIPVVSFIVLPAVNQIKAAFSLRGRETLITAYALSMVLMFILALALDPSMTVPSLMPAAFAKTFVAGWIAATAAGMAADSQKKTDAIREIPPAESPEIVADPTPVHAVPERTFEKEFRK